MNNFKKLISEFEESYKINLPLDDSMAYKMYPKHRQVYNKLLIAEFQNLDCGPYPIEPKKYPIVSKPIINLFGMGLNSKKIKNKNEFLKEHITSNFWLEYLSGKHLSWDLILRNGKILYHTCFFGKKKKFGSFIYWEQINEEIINNIKNITDNFLSDFTGCVNFETIGGKVIEVHLRMGDIDLTDIDIIKLVILNYIEPDNDVIKRQLKIINSKKINYVKLVPIWDKITENLEERYYFVQDKIKPYLEDDDKVINYYEDMPNNASPDGLKRWFLILTYDLNHCLKLRTKLENKIKLNS